MGFIAQTISARISHETDNHWGRFLVIVSGLALGLMYGANKVMGG